MDSNGYKVLLSAYKTYKVAKSLGKQMNDELNVLEEYMGQAIEEALDEIAESHPELLSEVQSIKNIAFVC